MSARNPKPAAEHGATAPFDLAAWTPARFPFAEVTRATAQVTRARSSQWVIAVGAISVAAITATVLTVDFNDPESDKVAVSSGSEAAVTDVRPFIDFRPGPSDEALYSADTATARMGGSSSRSLAPQLPGVAESAQLPAARLKEMPSIVRAREEPEGLSNSSPAESSANARNVTSSLPEGPILTATGGPTPNPKATNKAAERLAVQSHELAAGETAARNSFAPAQQRPAASVRTTTAGAMPDLQLPHLERDAGGSNLYSIKTSGLPANKEVVADGPMATARVADDAALDDVLLLDVELAGAAVAPILPMASAKAAEEIEFIPPSVDAQAISHSASLEDAGQLEPPQKIRVNEENARSLVPRQASGAFDEAVSPTAAAAPVAKVAALDQDPSAVGVAAAFPGPQAVSAEVFPGTVTTQVRVGGGDVGSLPLQFSTDALVSVRLADLISLFEDRMDRPLFVWLKSASSVNKFVTFDTLRSAGIDAQYDARTQQVALSIVHDQTP